MTYPLYIVACPRKFKVVFSLNDIFVSVCFFSEISNSDFTDTYFRAVWKDLLSDVNDFEKYLMQYKK